MTMAASAPISAKQQGGFDLVAFGAILVTILFWASSFVVIRICLGPLTPIELATARYVAAGAIALVYLVIYRPLPEKRDFVRLSIAAVLFIAA
ncbi:drug/metabolite transporter (DMT)-like permease [Rhizobium leguminosarum]|nr:drug/metabolite transporter (DMT)-like permease [Rhizobium leguminosarum]